MFNFLKIFAKKPVNVDGWPQPEGPVDAITNAAAGSGWDHPDVLDAAEQAQNAAPKTVVDAVDWDALGAVLAESVVEGIQNPTEEYNSSGFFGSWYFNYRTGRWDDGKDPNGCYNPIGYE